MKFPSVSRLLAELGRVLKTFPLESLFTFIACSAGTVFVELKDIHFEGSTLCWRVIMACNIGLLLSLSATLFASSRKLSGIGRWLTYIPAVLVSTLLFFVFDPLRRENDILRFVMISFGFHLLVAFAPFIGKKDQINGFWQFNRSLFLRFLAGALYSAVLFLGLSAAVGSMNFLFNFDFEGDTFAIMWIWIAGMFQTLFFLSAVPLDTDALEYDRSYPKGLKLFTQYVLIPLASVYVLILLAYEIKIIVQWNMPKGLVSSLILGYAVFGILSILLVYPLRNLEGNTWIRSFSKSFYFLLIPLLVLLYLAIGARVGRYGITEERYFVLVLALWLTFVTIYFLLSVKQNIMIIPVSLSIVTLFSVYGPFNAFSVSERSQLKQLENILAKNSLLEGGKLRKSAAKLDSADSERVWDVSRYMISHYGLGSFQPLLKEDLHMVVDSIKSSLKKSKRGRMSYSKWDLNEKQEEWLRTNYKLPVFNNTYATTQWETVVAEDEDALPVQGADLMIPLNYYHNPEDAVLIENTKNLYYDFRDSVISIRIGTDSVLVKTAPLIQRLQGELLKSNGAVTKAVDSGAGTVRDVPELSRAVLKEEFDLSSYHVQLLFNRLGYSASGRNRIINSADAVLLLKRR